jgi:4-amino-4-deoxy-L-arabinose transferase-like glycosyltransferase
MAKAVKTQRREAEPGPTLQPVPSPAAMPDEAPRPSLARALTPKILLDSTPAEWLMRQPAERRHLILLSAFAVLIFVPYLGAVGFWDPWEVHYGEVARSMIVRQDYVHPYWESAYFFSKPVGSLWMMVVGLLAAGVNNPARGTAIYTEWCVRSIFTATAIAGVLMIYFVTARTLSRRAGIWAAVILATSPIYFMLARQTVPDMPFVVFNTSAIACLMLAIFEKETVQDGWLYAFYALMGVAVLTKEFLGVGLPGLAMLLYLMFSGDWKLLARLRLFTGAVITALICGPWITVMSLFDGKDDESNTFAYRFFIHDQFKRLGYDPQHNEFVAGVHTTTPNTTFVYFIEQLGYGFFPWVATWPGIIAGFFGAPRITKARTRKEKARLFVVSWAISTFVLFAFAATKFHHYDFPVVPALAILAGLWIEDVLENGISKHAVALVCGLAIFGMVAQNIAMEPKHLTDLFVYNYERPYPSHEVDQNVIFTIPHLSLGALSFGGWPITNQKVFIILFAVAPIAALLLGATQVRRWLAAPDGVWLGSVQEELRAAGSNVRATLLSVPRALARALGWTTRMLGIRKPVVEEPEDRLYTIGALTMLAVCFAMFISLYHWRKLSVHWTQRDLFWEYHHLSTNDEPIGAYQMNWRGETFYSRNLVRQLKETNELKDFVAQPGRQWLLVEQGRLAGMKTTIGSGYDVKVVDKSNNKFALVVVSKGGSGESNSFIR